jgi:hypothetical protein
VGSLVRCSRSYDDMKTGCPEFLLCIRGRRFGWDGVGCKSQ